MRHATTLFLAALLWAAPLRADISHGAITEMASGLNAPWSIGFLPEGDILITEKRGRLLRLSNGRLSEIAGLPEIRVGGQGGLLDVLVPRDHTQSGAIYFSFVKRQRGGEGTAVARAQLKGRTLSNVQIIFEMKPGSSGGRHFGGRLAQDPQSGALFLTIGDRGDRPAAQDADRDNGKIIRIDPKSGAHETWTLGHRNPQGLAFAPDGQLWAHEHGARGGDEINRIVRGKNYGWPVISYGTHYSGAKIGEGTRKAGLEQPVFFWDPSIAPSGFAIHSGKGWSAMKNHMFIGSLKFDHISVMSPDGARELGRIETPETLRVRDVREGPQGAVWFLSEGQGALYRIAPL